MRIVEAVSEVRPHDRAELRDVEAKVRGYLPEDYVQFLLRENGGRPEPSVFGFQEHGEPSDSSVAWLFGLCDDPDYSLEANLEEYEGRIPGGLCPIACDPFGNLLLLCLKEDDYGAIWFWNHELEEAPPPTSNMSRVSDSFSRFIAELT